MDGLRSFLRFWKKWHFWILCPIIVGLGTGGWVLATNKLSKEFQTFAGQISSKQSEIQQVATTLNHPNARYQEEMNALIATRRESVRKAWEAKWEQQEKQLTWPASFPQQMLAAVQQMRPIEKISPETDPLPNVWREVFRDHITNELPKLAETIDSKWEPNSQAGSRSGYGYAMMNNQADTSLVWWNPENQSELVKNRFTWTESSYEPPTTLEVLYAQEDFWILQALMNIISRSNEGATDRSRAVVKEIDHIRIADDAVTKAGNIEGIGSSGAGDFSYEYSGGTASADAALPATGAAGGLTGPPTYGGGYAGSGGGGGYGYGIEAAGATAAMRGDPAEGRYVNRDFEPLSAEELRAATQSTEPGEAYLAVAKRVPVQMRLLVDSRRINQLLAQCANSELTVEVRQWRFNTLPSEKPTVTGGYGGYGYGASSYGAQGGVPTYGSQPSGGASDTDSGATGGVPTYGPQAGGGASGYGASGGYGYGTGPAGVEIYDPTGYLPKANLNGYGSSSGYSGSGYAGAGESPNRRGFYDKYIELLGIIYIYNPVNPAVLGIEAENPDAAALAGGL